MGGRGKLLLEREKSKDREEGAAVRVSGLCRPQTGGQAACRRRGEPLSTQPWARRRARRGGGTTDGWIHQRWGDAWEAAPSLSRVQQRSDRDATPEHRAAHTYSHESG